MLVPDYWEQPELTESYSEFLRAMKDDVVRCRHCAGPIFQVGDKMVSVVCFAAAATTYGLPAALLTDKGAVFTAASRGHGSVASNANSRLGIRLRHCRPYHPGDLLQGRTLPPNPEELADPATPRRHPDRAADPARRVPRPPQHPPPAPRARPTHSHRGLHRPAETRSRRPPVDHPQPHRVRHDKIDKAGIFILGHNSRLQHIGVGRAMQAPTFCCSSPNSTSESSPKTANSSANSPSTQRGLPTPTPTMNDDPR